MKSIDPYTWTPHRLRDARASIRHVLACGSTEEVVAVRDALTAGRIEGTRYFFGGCGCLLGTMARERFSGEAAEFVVDLRAAISSSVATREAEEFFRHIHRGDTSETSEYAALALRWVDEHITERAARTTPSAVAPESAYA